MKNLEQLKIELKREGPYFDVIVNTNPGEDVEDVRGHIDKILAGLYEVEIVDGLQDSYTLQNTLLEICA